MCKPPNPYAIQLIDNTLHTAYCIILLAKIQYLVETMSSVYNTVHNTEYIYHV